MDLCLEFAKPALIQVKKKQPKFSLMVLPTRLYTENTIT